MNIRPALRADLPIVRSLLESEKLPTDLVDEEKGEVWVVEDGGIVIGAGAFEFYGNDALLRSVVLSGSMKFRGIGTTLVDHLEGEAVRRGTKMIWLLTETAEGFFAKRGYGKVDRAVIVNKGLLDSAEFRHVCASTAVCMRKTVETKVAKGEK